MKKNFIIDMFIALAGLLMLGSFYVYFSGALVSNADNNSPLSSSALGGAINTNNDINQDTGFLSTLSSLTRIKIDNSLFTAMAFRALVDNDVPIEQIPAGRANPFAVLDKSITGEKDQAKVVTLEASGVTTTQASLNGSISTSTPGSSGYFEYGTAVDLGKTTPVNSANLVGSFSAKIINLKPKTTYYFRAASKLSGVPFYGETLSFVTN